MTDDLYHPHRYHRQTLLPEVGLAGQSRLAAGRVLVVGVGALGCTIAEQLARAGVGHLTFVDRDVVELTNLQRQVLFTEADARAGVPKAVAAAGRLAAVNSSIKLESIVADVDAETLPRLLARARPHVIVDGTDNAPTRYLINDAAVRGRLPWVYGGCVGTVGRSFAILPGVGPCLRCLFPTPPGAGELPTCDTAGVLGPAAAVVGALAAATTLRLLIETTTDQKATTDPRRKATVPARGAAPVSLDPQNEEDEARRGDEGGRTQCVAGVTQRGFESGHTHAERRQIGASGPRPTDYPLTTIDLWPPRFRTIDLTDARRTECPCCGRAQYPFLFASPRQAVTLCGRNTVQIRLESLPESLDALAARLESAGQIIRTPHLLRFTPGPPPAQASQPQSITLFPDGRLLVGGVGSAQAARALVARYLGV